MNPYPSYSAPSLPLWWTWTLVRHVGLKPSQLGVPERRLQDIVGTAFSSEPPGAKLRGSRA
ncbi:MAG TPA: hypothetical protein VHI52_00035, partial [Verrucomicrobiae bacterium]|nr:hypothetical protein [Verrucomicrobiae bacterium]